MDSRAAPEGWQSVTPRLIVEDPAGLVAFMKHVFDASGEFRSDGPSELRIGDSIVLVRGLNPRDPMPGCLYVYVEDIDATYARAIAAGAESMEAPTDLPYGDRRGMVRDPFGNTWQIATRQQPTA